MYVRLKLQLNSTARFRAPAPHHSPRGSCAEMCSEISSDTCSIWKATVLCLRLKSTPATTTSRPRVPGTKLVAPLAMAGLACSHMLRQLCPAELLRNSCSMDDEISRNHRGKRRKFQENAGAQSHTGRGWPRRTWTCLSCEDCEDRTST